jgi:hypothetical protein
LSLLTRGTIKSALVPHTIKSYDSATRWYVRLCEVQRVIPFPLNIDNACMYLTYICMFVQLDSAIKYLSGVRNSHTLLGFTDIQGNKELLRLCIRGLKRQYPVRARFSKEPITVMLLAEFKGFLDLTQHFDRLFWAASTGAVYQFWRGSEFLVSPGIPKSNTLTKLDHTWLDPVEFTSSSTRLSFTKTEWWKEDVTTYAWANESVTSPTHAHRAYELGSPPRAQRARWLYANSDGSPLTKAQMIKRTKELAVKCRRNPKRFIASSWRCGAATCAARAGLSDRLVKALGRWKGDSYMRYTFSSANELQMASDAFGRISSPAHWIGEAFVQPQGAARTVG